MKLRTLAITGIAASTLVAVAACSKKDEASTTGTTEATAPDSAATGAAADTSTTAATTGTMSTTAPATDGTTPAPR